MDAGWRVWLSQMGLVPGRAAVSPTALCSGHVPDRERLVQSPQVVSQVDRNRAVMGLEHWGGTGMGQGLAEWGGPS